MIKHYVFDFILNTFNKKSNRNLFFQKDIYICSYVSPFNPKAFLNFQMVTMYYLLLK